MGIMGFHMLDLSDQFFIFFSRFVFSVNKCFNDIAHEQFTSDFTTKPDHIRVQFLFLAYRAVVISRTKAERIPGTLLTALLIPTPVPQIQTPRSAWPLLLRLHRLFYQRLDSGYVYGHKSQSRALHILLISKNQKQPFFICHNVITTNCNSHLNFSSH